MVARRPLVRGRATASPINGNMFGLHMQSLTGFNSPSVTPYHDLGQKVWRLWDTDTTWRRIEPSKGTYYLDRINGLLDIAEQHGLFVLYTMGQAPAFATGGTPGGPYTGSGIYNNKVPNLTDWQDHVAFMVDTFQGRIHGYELWNEVDIDDFWAGTVADQMALISAAAPIIRAGDPDALILGPSFTGGHAPKIFLDYYLQAGLGPLVDGFCYHSYVFPLQPEAIKPQSDLVRAVMERYGVGDKQLWQTECSWYTYYDNGVFVDRGGAIMPEALASDYIVRTYLASIAARFDCSVFYGLDYSFPRLRLIDLNNKSVVLAAGTALSQAAGILDGAKFISVEQSGALYKHRFVLSDGRRMDVYHCNDDQTKTVDLAGYDSAQDVQGSSVAISGSVTITMSPIYCFMS